MTPEQLQAMYGATHARVMAIAAEEEALEAIDTALDAYARLRGWDLAAIVDPVIEQPVSMPAGSDGAGEGDRPVETPAPDAPDKRRHHPRGQSGLRRTPASQAGGAGSTPAPRSTTCPQCGKTAVSAQGLAVHLARAHGVAGATRPAARGASPPLIGKAAQAVQPTTTNGRESYLCPRCSAPLPDRDALLNHMQKGHKPAPPASTRPFGPQLSVERTRGGGAFSE